VKKTIYEVLQRPPLDTSGAFQDFNEETEKVANAA